MDPDSPLDEPEDNWVIPLPLAQEGATPATFVIPEAHPPRVWTVFGVFIVSMVLYLAASVLCVLVALITAHEGPIRERHDLDHAVSSALTNPKTVLAAISCAGIVFLLMSLLGAALSGVPWRDRLALRRPQLTVAGMGVALLGTTSVGVMFVGLSGLGAVPDSHALTAINDLISGLKGSWLLVGVLLIGILPGIAEELLFRGYIQTRLVERWGVHAGVFISALLFGLMHFDPVQGAFAAFLGMFLGYLTVWTRSVIPAMICHAFNNSVSVVLTTMAPGFDDFRNPRLSMALLGISIVVFAGSLAYLRNDGAGRAEILAVRE